MFRPSHNLRHPRLAQRALAAALCLWLGPLCVLTCELMPAEVAAMTLGLAPQSYASDAAPHAADACASSGHDCCRPPEDSGRSGGHPHAVTCCPLLTQPLDTVKKFAPEPLLVAVGREAPLAPHAAALLLVKDFPSGWPPDTVPLFLRNRVLLI